MVLLKRLIWLIGLVGLACGSTNSDGKEGGGSGGSSNSNSSGGSGGSGGGGVSPGPSSLEGALLFRAADEWTPRTDPISQETELVLQSVYKLRRFFPNGLAYVGKENDRIDQVSCDEPSEGECVAYQFDAARGVLTLDGEALAFSQNGQAVTLGDESWQMVGAMGGRPLEGRFRLAGYFGYQSGSGAVVDGATLELSASGRFTASREKRAYAILAYELWPSCSEGCTLSGTYTVGEHSLTVTTDSGKSKTLFLKLEGGELQVGPHWYAPF